MNVRAAGPLDCCRDSLQITDRLAERGLLLLLSTFCVLIRGSAELLDSVDPSDGMGYLNSILASPSQIHADDAPVSGGGLSQNGKFSYGYASSPGKRASMEDFYETRIDGVEGEIVGLFGVFDVMGCTSC
ncbi:hypothetical protein EUGRSUZ_C01879 [Eucalyptus grandis]|uniref:Uncharacterized protein n=2 Tax=Eucalyptus grandis TaxID=71139 RepID=A0A059CRG5_EUCGR|nr:hypothetical protein EUGRSUZ_C01879 [Eucalyptus grandis]